MFVGEEIVENTLEQERIEAARNGSKELSEMINFFWNNTIPQLCVYLFLWWILFSILKNRPLFKKHKRWTFPVSALFMLIIGFVFFKNNVIFATVINLLS